MRKAINIQDLKLPEQKKEKPIEFVDFFCDIDENPGWKKSNQISNINAVYHLGKTFYDFDLFIVEARNTHMIYRGHLNDGVY